MLAKFTPKFYIFLTDFSFPYSHADAIKINMVN